MDTFSQCLSLNGDIRHYVRISKINVLPTLGLIIRYVDFDQGKVVDTFYRLLQVNRGDADTVVQAILAAFEEDNLNLQDLVGIGVDGASAMVGRHHSVSTLLKQLVPHLVTIRCVAHSLAKVNITVFLSKMCSIDFNVHTKTIKYQMAW